MIQLYANLGVKINGDLLREQAGLLIEDHVNRRCRITVESCMPQKGPEVDARLRLGETVKLSVHILTRRISDLEVSPALVEIEGPIVASRISQELNGEVRAVFTVEQARLATEDE